jgi:integrase
MKAVNDTEIVVYFPKKTALATTQLVLKSPKTQSSIRKIFLPRSVAEMLLSWKEGQDYTKSILREDYKDYNLVLASETGLPADPSSITDSFRRLIKEHDLPQVVFHSLRHSSITYKLKLNGGDVKAVQGDSGHAQASMVTEVYSHILDDDRKNNARLFEEAFYSRKGRKASKGAAGEGLAGVSPDSADMATLIRLLEKPETAALLKALAATLGK